MTYLPSAAPRLAASLASPDGLPITQNGQPRLATLAQIAAFVTGTITTGDAREALAVTTPGPQTAGVAFVLSGTYTVIAPAALDSSVDGGASWMPATAPQIGNGAFSFSLTVSTANPAQTVLVRDHGAQATIASSGAFAVAAAAGESAEGTIVTTVGPTITDAAGNTYGISSAGYVVTNGAPETTISANVIEIAYHAPVAGGPRQFYQKNASGNWFTRTSVTAVYTQTTDPTAPGFGVGTSPYFQVANGKIYTPSGAVFKAKGVNVTPYTGYAPSTYASVKRFFPGINFIRMVTAAGYAQGGQNGVVSPNPRNF